MASSEIDRLYQLPPGEFTAARNALAKKAGPHAAEIRRLAKPSVPAWAINQLYWKRREDYDALLEASTELRKVHKAVLGGGHGDIRDAAKRHDAALDAALKSTLALLREEGQPATDATRQAVLTTLRALPSDEPPGRLTHALQPGGFEMLAGLSVAAARGKPETAKKPVRVEPAKPESRTAGTRKADAAAAQKKQAAREAKEHARALQHAREAAAKAARELRAAEHDAKREEFEAARATREAEKAAHAADRAREALETAKRALDGARGRAEAADAALARLKNG